MVVGWRATWFLTDDAFIAFRYVHNSIEGFGYVWNRPPFLPVEGYTSFLWVVLLEWTWRLAGLPPPEAANLLSLACSLGTVLVLARMAWELLSGRLASGWRLLWLGLFLAGVVSNRTVLVWTSSGLETALFVLLLTAWVACGLRASAHRSAWRLGISCLAALLALTRPDGLLFAAATFVLVLAVRPRGEPSDRQWLGTWASLAPLLIVGAHLTWRRLTYGAWLPNTYFAKVTEAWPEAGLRYAAAFVIEYGLWVWIFLLAYGARTLVTEGRRVARTAPRDRIVAPTLVTATLLAHLAYYTLIVGGDHFEYRIYAHLPGLILLGGIWLLLKLSLGRGRAVAFLALAVALALPIPWVHARAAERTRGLGPRTWVVPVAPHLPGPVRFYGRAFDALERWLIDRYIGVRHHTHRRFLALQTRRFPPRERGAEIGGEGNPVYAGYTVGVPGWVLPNAYVLDLHGLNDPIIARSSSRYPGIRRMAHERVAPPGYVACLEPNVRIRDGEIIVEERAAPLSDERIVSCQRSYL